MASVLVSLVDGLRQYRLLDATQLTELATFQSRSTDPKELAKELVRRGWLTIFQAKLLLQSKGQDLLLGSYILLDRLGEGGMGQVFKARNWKLGKIVALKFIHKERMANPDAAKRFQREVRAAAQLNHPNVVLAYDADEVSGAHMLVMEYVDGTDLSALVKKTGPLPVNQACDFIRQAALGLQHAFEKGLVHRDIKPSNLLLAKGNVVKILDMGLARLDATSVDGDQSSMTQEGAIMGTPDYIAPEQALDSHRVDIRGDIYALGSTLYFLLTAQPPFPGGSMTEKLLKRQLEDPPPVEQLRREIPLQVAAVVRKMVARKAENRYQTPIEVAGALAALASSGSSTPCQDERTMVEPATRQRATPSRPEGDRRRRRILMMAGGGGLVVGLLVLVGVLKMSQRSPQQVVKATADRPTFVQRPRDTAKEGALVPPEARVGDRAHGLKVEFYDFYPKDAQGIDSLDIAKRWIADHKPDLIYALNVRSIDFPPGPEGTAKPLEVTLGQFLLGARELAQRKEVAKRHGEQVPERLDQVIGSRTIYVFTGFIKADKAGTYTIQAPCDDQVQVSIGGIVVHTRPHFGGMTAPDHPENTSKFEIAEPGIYPIKVLLYDRDPVGLGIEIFSDLNPSGERHNNGKLLLPILQVGGR